MSDKSKYEMLGVRLQLREIVRLQMFIKKHFLYINAINDAKGNRILQDKLRLMLVQVERLKKNMENYRKTI